MLTAVLLLTGLTVEARAAEDPGVAEATSRLQAARQHVDELDSVLEAAALSYQRADEHRQRLVGEMAASTQVLSEADAAVSDAEDELDQRVAAAYKRPGRDLVAADAFMHSSDAASALHSAALFSRFTVGGATRVAHVKWAAALTRTDVTQERVVAAGAEASVVLWEAQADQLEESLKAAQREVLGAEEGVLEAREEAERRAAAAEAARLAAAAAGGGDWSSAPPPPSVDGKTCPVGTPNGFIDSWGFPRSGGRRHEGVDMFAPMGTALYAVADGEIYRVYTNTLGGLAINLIDEAGNMYYYAHLSAAHVRSGQRVESGQIIGAVGDSGNARGTPPHLHWQFHPGNGSPVNPFPLAHALCRG